MTQRSSASAAHQDMRCSSFTVPLSARLDHGPRVSQHRHRRACPSRRSAGRSASRLSRTRKARRRPSTRRYRRGGAARNGSARRSSRNRSAFCRLSGTSAEFAELRLQQAEQVVEGGVVARVRGSGQEHEMPRRGSLPSPARPLSKLVALVAGRLCSTARRCAPRRRRRGSGQARRKSAAAAVRLDVVKRNHREGIDLEHRLVRSQARARDGVAVPVRTVTSASMLELLPRVPVATVRRGAADR